MKRGKDHIWEKIRYKADMGLYLKCKCGFRYCAGNTMRIEPQKDITAYNYCPFCGARKKWITEQERFIDKFSFEY